MFSGFHSSCYDPKRCTLGSRRNKRSPWVPCPIEVDGGSWRTGAQEHSAAFPTRTAAARLVSRMSSEAEELSDAGQGAISAEESLSDGSGRDETGSCRNRKNKTGIKRSPSEWDPICTNVSEDEVLQAVENARKVELGVGSLGWAKNIWKPKPPHFNKQGVRRLILRCPFRGAANADCCALLRMTEDNQGQWTLERNRIPHADHTQNHKKKGLSKFMKASTTSPSKAGLTGGNVLRRMRDEHGAVTDQERRQIQGVLKRKKTADRCAVVPKDLQGSFGGLQMWADHNSRKNLTERGEFGIHTTYVCGTLQIDAAKNKINMAYSTENLLLNAYRQGQHGMPSIVHVDCTHRVVVDGHACMLFGTVDTAQHFHVVRL